MALVHSRFSTNTLGSWDLAHPFHYLAHNGEINTVRGNTQWMHAREPQLRSAQLGDDLPKLFPLIDERWSDSAALDAAFELLVLAGRAPAHALAMLIPAAWSQATPMADDLRAFYEFHAGMLEPWDGPAAIAFCDGRQAGATLDRNGLRPCRYQVTRDGLLVLASEAGVLDLDPADVVVNDRLRPGQMLIVDTDAGRIRGDDEIKRALARRRPYRALLDEQKIYLEDIPSPPVEPPAPDALERDLRLFGYSEEELLGIIAPMARDGQEPIASMGVDTPLAALSRRPRLLRGFFKQLFAQVTNPAIDPQRETLVMSLRTAVGAQGNLLDESPDHARRLAMAQPVLTSGDLAKLRALPRDRFRTVTLDCTFDARGGGRALERALDALCRRASRAIALGEEILILSDRTAGPEAAPIPALLATAAVHSHLVREGWRTKCGLIVESGEPREVMDFALLVGFGAAAVNPYVALDLVAAQWAGGEVPAGSAEEAQARYVQAVGKGLLKVLSKMGVSTVMSYRGAQLFECVGLSADVVARYFTGTPSRVGGIGLEQIAGDVLRRQEHALAGGELDPGGVYAYRLRGERHVWNPEVISSLQRAVRDEHPESYSAFSAAADEENRLGGALRGLVEFVPAAEPLPLSEVEPSSEIVRRFASGAMSLGSISKEAHETLAIALNRLGGRSNSGEGGEDARRSRARRQRRLAALGHQAGGLGALRRDHRLPGRRRRAADQGLAGRQARRGRTAAGPQGRRRDRAPAPLHSRRRADLPSPAPRHLLHRGPGTADPRPALCQPIGGDQRQARRARRRRHGRRRRGQGRRRPHRDRRHGRRHRRLADVVDPARGRALGARPGRDAAGAGRERPARARAPAGRRRSAHGARRRDRCAAGRRGVRLLDRSARRGGLHHDARLPPQHLPGRHRDAGSRAAQALRRDARAHRAVPPVRGRGGARADGAARHPPLRRADRPHRPGAPGKRRRRRHRPPAHCSRWPSGPRARTRASRACRAPRPPRRSTATCSR